MTPTACPQGIKEMVESIARKYIYMYSIDKVEAGKVNVLLSQYYKRETYLPEISDLKIGIMYPILLEQMV